MCVTKNRCFWLIIRFHVSNQHALQLIFLKTILQGVYVLQDHNFQWFQHISFESGAPGEKPTPPKLAEDYLHIPCGVIRGALTHLGVTCTVQADMKELPACK